MVLQKLKFGDKFLFAEKQEVRTTTYSEGEVTENNTYGRGTKGEVVKVNPKSVRVKLTFRDKQREPELCTLRFSLNKNVTVEKL